MPNCPVCNYFCPDGTRLCFSCGAPLPNGAPSQALAAGTYLNGGKYTVGRVLGQGGFGITYLGSDTGSHRTVAIKEFFLQGCIRQGNAIFVTGTTTQQSFDDFKRRFLNEGKLLSSFHEKRYKCEGIVEVITDFEENNTAYIVMEYLKGQTLLEVLTNRRGPLPEAEAVAYVVKVAEALEAIHNAGLIHRDIKPDNIIVTETGRVVLIDFGSTRKYAASEMGIMTALIAPGYSPLEQYSRKSEFFAPTLDIYALGATLYHLLTNARPEDATDRVNADALRQPISLNPNISRKTNDSIMRAMKMDPKARFQSARQFVNALQGTPGIVSLPGPQLPIPFPSRQPFPIPLWKKVLPVVLIIFAIAFIAFGPYIKSSPPPYQKPVQKPGQTSGSDVKPPDVPPPTPSPSDPVINQKFDVPIRPQNVKSGSYTYNPNTCSVTISGPTSKVSLIKQDNIHLFVDLNEHGGNSDTYTVQLSLDPGIDRSSVSYDPRTTKVNKKQPKPPPPPPSHTPPKPPPPP